MSNIYLKIPIENFWGKSQNIIKWLCVLDVEVSFKNLLPGQSWGAPTHEDIIEF